MEEQRENQKKKKDTILTNSLKKKNHQHSPFMQRNVSDKYMLKASFWKKFWIAFSQHLISNFHVLLYNLNLLGGNEVLL